MAARSYFSRTLTIPAHTAAVSLQSLINTAITAEPSTDTIINPCGSLSITPLLSNTSGSSVWLGDSTTNLNSSSYGQSLSPGQNKFYPYSPARHIQLDLIFIGGSTTGLSINIEVMR